MARHCPALLEVPTVSVGLAGGQCVTTCDRHTIVTATRACDSRDCREGCGLSRSNFSLIYLLSMKPRESFEHSKIKVNRHPNEGFKTAHGLERNGMAVDLSGSIPCSSTASR